MGVTHGVAYMGEAYMGVAYMVGETWVQSCFNFFNM